MNVNADTIRNWLQGRKLEIVDLKDDNCHFKVSISPTQPVKMMIPIFAGMLKKLINGNEVFLLGFGWKVDTNSEVVMAVFNDNNRTSNLVTSLRKIIDPTKYKLSFLPTDHKIEEIKVVRGLLTNSLNPDSLFREINSAWVQWGNILNQIQKNSGYDYAVPSKYT